MTCASGRDALVELSEARATRRGGGSVAVVLTAMTEAAPRAATAPRTRYVRRMVRESPKDKGMRNGCLFPCTDMWNQNGDWCDPCARKGAIFSESEERGGSVRVRASGTIPWGSRSVSVTRL